MTTDSDPKTPDLFQKLLELEYGLIEREEEEALRQRIAAEPELARLHADVLQAKQSISRAARVRAPTMEWTTILDGTGAKRPSRLRRWLRVSAAVAASVCLAALAANSLWYSYLVRGLTADQVALKVVGPARLSAEVSNQFEVLAEANEEPVANADLELVLVKDDGKELYRRRAKSDDAGRAEFRLPADIVVSQVQSLRVELSGDSRFSLAAPLTTEPARHIVRLSTDRPVYQPGETIHYRALVLEPLDLKPARVGSARFVLLDPRGQIIPGSQRESVLEQGVASGSFEIPPEQNGGAYELKVSSPEGVFEDVTLDIVLRSYRPPRFQKELEFARDSYGPGEEVIADLSVASVDGRPAAGARLAIRALLGGQAFHEKSARAGDDGTYPIQFVLPSEIASDDAVLVVSIDDGAVQETIAKEIPLASSVIDLALLPESGVIVPGIENRIYFHALGSDGKPVHVKGRVLDARGETTAQFETSRDGMGRFSMTPRADEQYRLAVETPANVSKLPDFPRARGDAVLLNAGAGVFAANEPITIDVRSNRRGVPLVLAVTCRGVPVAHRMVEADADSTPVSIDLPPAASGVLRLTAFDPSARPLRPIAERLVYRHPGRRLNVSVAGIREQASPGDPADLTIFVKDETGEPARGAVLGVSVVDRSSFRLLDRKFPSQDAQIFLTSQIAHPADLEDANFFLGDNPDAADALDLVLATHGWRTFQSSELEIAQGPEVVRDPIRVGAEAPRDRPKAEIPPLVADNLLEIDRFEGEYRARLDEHARRRQRTLLATVVILGLVLLGSLFLTTKRRAFWTVACVVGVGAVLVGVAVALQFIVHSKAPPLTDAVKSDVQEHRMADEAPADEFRSDVPSQEMSPLEALADVPPSMEPTPPAMSPPPPMLAMKPETDAIGRAAPEAEIGLEDGQRDLAPAEGQAAKAAGAGPTRLYAHRRTGRRAGGDRHDGAQCVYWNPLLVTDESGQAKAAFALSDAVTTFDVRIDGHTQEGRLGSGSDAIVSRLPLRIEPKLPIEISAGDQIDVPLSVYNQSSRPWDVSISAGSDGGLQFLGNSTMSVALAPGQSTRVYLPVEAKDIDGATTLTLYGVAGDFVDHYEQTVQIVPRGFPRRVAYSGEVKQGGGAEFILTLPDDVLPGTLSTSLRVYPDLVHELLDGVESLFREPRGCFEQASSSSDSNVLVMRYLQQNGLARPGITRQCREMLDRGYARLVGFECKEHGFEWFGRDPASLALTAYGLQQLHDMSAVYPVEASLLDRTRTWLLDRRGGDGGFRPNAVDNFGNAPADVTDAYVTWALVEAGTTGMDREVERVGTLAETSSNPYLVALAAMVLRERSKDLSDPWGKRADRLLDRLASMQSDDGSLLATAPSITLSSGHSLRVETTALGILAWTRSERHRAQADRALEWIVSSRDANGGFGTTQATILALRAIAANSRRSAAPLAGSIALYRSETDKNDAPRERRITARGISLSDSMRPPDAGNFASALKPGENRLRLSSDATGDLRYTVGVHYRTDKAGNSDDCPIGLEVSLGAQKCQAGDSIAMRVQIANRKDEPQPMTIANIGLPAGLDAPTEILDRLRERGHVDYYEIRPREIILYWLGLKPKADIRFSVDLVAIAPGTFTGPPSRAYLYYSPEHEVWLDPITIQIKR